MTALTITGKWSTKRKSIDIDHIFLEDLEGIPDGTEVCAVITTDRNPDGLRAYWALLGSIVRSGDGGWQGDKDSLDDFIRQGVGFGKWRVIASEEVVDHTGFDAAWEAFGAVAGETSEKVKAALHFALTRYLKTVPARSVFIPDSIALSKCDGRKFGRFWWAMEKFLADRLGVNVDDHKREASASQRRAA